MREKISKAQELYRQAIEALGDTKLWREWRREMDRQAVIRGLKSNRVGRQAGRQALKDSTHG
jgi:hypothetical protein